MKGFEPSASRATIWRANQLRHIHHIRLLNALHRMARPKWAGTPEGTRTPDLLLRRQLLYPTELLAHIGAGDGNRTHATSLEGWGSAIELHPRNPRWGVLMQSALR